MPEVLPVTIAKEKTQARLPSTKKQIYVVTAIYDNRAVVSTGGPALFDARNHVPNYCLTALSGTTFCVYYIYIFLRIPGTGYVSDSTILVSICALKILMTLYLSLIHI